MECEPEKRVQIYSRCQHGTRKKKFYLLSVIPLCKEHILDCQSVIYAKHLPQQIKRLYCGSKRKPIRIKPSFVVFLFSVMISLCSVCMCVSGCVCVVREHLCPVLKNRRSLQGLPVWADSGIYRENNQKAKDIS